MFLEHVQQFQEIPWHATVDARPDERICLVLPMAVIDELDGKKRAQETWIRNRALTSLSRIVRALRSQTQPEVLTEVQPPYERRAEDPWEPVLLDILTEPWRYRRLPIADSEIVARAHRL